MRRTLALISALVVTGLSLHFLTTGAPFKRTDGAPASPSKSAAIPTQASRDSYNPTDGTIKFFQWRVSLDPTSYSDYDRLGAAYTQKARETGDITYYQLAEDALDKSLSLESTHAEAISATVHIANVYFAEHRFTDSLSWARKTLALKTGDVSEFATIGDCLMNLGDYNGARAAYAELVPSLSRPYMGPGLTYLRESRFAGLDVAEGRPCDSVIRMKRAIAAAHSAGMHTENIAWTEYMLGFEYFRIGELANAEGSYRDSLAAYPGYHSALAGLGELRAAQGRYTEAIQLYQRAIGVIPLPVYVAALGDLYAKVGRTREAKREYELVEYIARLSALSKSLFNRELALFYADHDLNLNEAVSLARNELAVRKDVYTWDVLAFSLHKNGQEREAAAADANALRLGTQDPILFFHAGMIAHARGDDRSARQYLERALALNPHFHIFYADQARRILGSIATEPAQVARGDRIREAANVRQ